MVFPVLERRVACREAQRATSRRGPTDPTLLPSALPPTAVDRQRGSSRPVSDDRSASDRVQVRRMTTESQAQRAAEVILSGRMTLLQRRAVADLVIALPEPSDDDLKIIYASVLDALAPGRPDHAPSRPPHHC